MTVRKTFQGAWCISEVINGYLKEIQYMGYTKKEAIEKFKKQFYKKV